MAYVLCGSGWYTLTNHCQKMHQLLDDFQNKSGVTSEAVCVVGLCSWWRTAVEPVLQRHSRMALVIILLH
jgi:hypothetical protein